MSRSWKLALTLVTGSALVLGARRSAAQAPAVGAPFTVGSAVAKSGERAYGAITVPRGVVHRTRAPERAVILMVEAAGVVPTGD